MKRKMNKTKNRSDKEIDKMKNEWIKSLNKSYFSRSTHLKSKPVLPSGP